MEFIVWIIIVFCIAFATIMVSNIGKSGNEYIESCPACGYKGIGKIEGGASLIVGFILCLLFLPLGIIYIILASKRRVVCPKCHINIRKI